MLLFGRRSPSPIASPSRTRQRPGKRASLFQHPRLEVLEDRTLPSTFVVTQLGDSGTGSLRQAVASADAAGSSSTITFAVTGTITLTSGPLTISNSVTLQGPSAGNLSISNTGSLTEAGSGTITLTGGNDSAGAVTVSSGGLTIPLGSILCVSSQTLSGITDHWSGDNTTADSAGNNNLTLVGGAGYAPGQIGPAFSFTGSSDPSQFQYAEANPIVFGTSDFTISFWMRTTNSGYQSVIGDRVDQSGGNFYQARMNNGRIVFELDEDVPNGTTPADTAVSSSQVLSDGLFHHIAIVRSGTTLSLYIDGALASTDTTPVLENLNVSHPFNIGAEPITQLVPSFAGQIDDVQVYNGTALSLSQIQSIRDAGLGGSPPTGSRVTVNGGTLLVDGSVGDVTVNSGGTLGGTGTVGAVTVSGGTVEPGDPAGFGGALRAASADFSGGGTLLVQLASLSPTASFNPLSATGAVTLGGTSALTLNLNGLTTPGAAAGILSSGSLTGSFSSVTVLNNPANLQTTVVADSANSNQLDADFQSNQTITFGALSNRTYGDAPFTVSASASSGLPVSFSIVAGGQYASINGNTITILGATPTGSVVTVEATQAGDANYRAAQPVDQSFTIAGVNPTIMLTQSANAVLDLGTPLIRNGSFQDPGSSGESVQVNYGDGSGAQPVPLSSNQMFTLQHLYIAEGAYNVTLTLTDSSGQAVSTSFIVNVLLPGTTNAATAIAPPGSIVTATTKGASITLFHAAGAPLPAIVLVANISNTEGQALLSGAGSLGSQRQTGVSGVSSAGVPSEATSYDVRALNVVPADGAVVSFQYPANGIGLPVLAYFDRATGTYQSVQGSTRFPGSVVVDLVHHTITLILDATSTPSLLNLGGTVFTVSVPVAVSTPAFVSLNFLESSSSQSPMGGQSFSNPTTPSALAQSNFLALAQLSFLLTMEDGVVGVAEDEANVVADLPLPGSSAILLPTVTLSPSQAGLLQMEEEGPGSAPVGTPAPILPVSSPPATPPPPRQEPTTLPGTDSRNDTDRINPDLFFAWAVQDAFGERLELPARSVLVDDRLEAALLVSGGLFGLGFEVVPVGTDAERRHRRW